MYVIKKTCLGVKHWRLQLQDKSGGVIFTALCDFYGIDQDDMVGVYYEKGEFFSASAKFDINGKQHKITIKRDGDGNTL